MAKQEERALEASYRMYVTDSFYLQGQNKYLTRRWKDITTQKTDGRSGDEIAIDIIERHGLRLKE